MAWRGTTVDDMVRERLRDISEQWAPRPMPLLDPPTPLLLDETDVGPGRWRARLDGRGARAFGGIVVALVLVANWTWWQGQPREVITAAVPAATASGTPVHGEQLGGEVVVHVIGDVRHPGVVRLPTGSRITDAIAAAGGARHAAALSTVNLARLVVDGEQIDVGATASAADSGVSVNAANAAEFEALPGIGPVLAQRIVAWREAHGPFRSVDDLGDVPGIGDAVLGQVRELVHL